MNVSASKNTIQLSVVMPCLNEEKTITKCIRKAVKGISKTGLKGEVIVSDNGSSDNSQQLAQRAGAVLVYQPKRGYGNAYLKGLEAAKGEFLVIGDSDDTYDFGEIPRFVDYLKQGYDYVNGSRLKGEIKPGAMPILHRYLGVPVLSWLVNVFYQVNVSDAHCGLRAFTKDALKKMHLQTPGMEFASEMIIKAAKAHLKIADVPITYYPRGGQSKLRSVRDGFRHLFFIINDRFHLAGQESIGEMN